MLIVVLVGTVALQIWTWKRLVGRVSFGNLTKLQAVARYGCWACAPLLLVAAIFFTTVCLEEWLGIALLSDPMGRATPLVAIFLLATALIGWAAFALRCTLIRHVPTAPRL
ncbi:MAG: hypothetical protein HYX75_22950 [Acidobacteria bacterium]|nr:hypothetical protein [Acidobacteriota bacterium]